MNKVEFQTTTTKTFVASGSSALDRIGKETRKIVSIGAILARPVSPSAAVASTASTATPVPHPGSHIALISGALAFLILIATIIFVSILLRRRKKHPRRVSLPPFSSSPNTRSQAGNNRHPTRLSTESIQLAYLSPLASSSKLPSITPPDVHESISVPQNTYKTHKPASRQIASTEDSSGIRALNMSRYGSRAEALGPPVPKTLPLPDSTLASPSSASSPFIPDPSLHTRITPSSTQVSRVSTHFDESPPIRGNEAEISTNATDGILDGPPPAYEHGRREKS